MARYAFEDPSRSQIKVDIYCGFSTATVRSSATIVSPAWTGSGRPGPARSKRPGSVRPNELGPHAPCEILDAANRLMFVRGVNATTLDDVLEASQTSDSRLYHHFTDKQELVRALVKYRGALVLQRERGGLERLRSFSGLVRWRNAVP
ncbi:helix-turn-helix domain-containing protein [Micromonospora sp. NPDC049559]|uniref:helix-turn-helix domain-containing protein n=1 Tax=Micromonospora sp. NPDC049559 TaxID=3155923 RepID=UPI003425A0DF